MQRIQFNSIGEIQTIYDNLKSMPVQPAGAKGSVAQIKINEEYVEGLQDLEAFSHIILIYYLHEVKSHQLKVIPFMDDQPHGIFATRSPKRPNPIGISTVRLLKIEKNILTVEGADVLNGTPLLDIKPFFAKFDNREHAKSGWLDENWKEEKRNMISDDRFVD